MFKEMDKIEIMWFHQPSSTIFFGDPDYKRPPSNFTSYTSKDA